MRSGLKTEVADETAAIPFVAFESATDDLKIALQSPAGREGFVLQNLSDDLLEVREVAIEYFLGEGFFGPEVVCKGAVRGAGCFTDVAHRRILVSKLKHYLEAGVEDVFAQGWLHVENNTLVRIENQPRIF